MIQEEPIAPGPAALTEAKAFLRVDGASEDALIGALVATACALCEAFIGQMLIARGVTETVAAGAGWTRLGRTPVLSVTGVAEVGAGGAATAVPAGEHGVDIDADGDGWVRAGGAFVAPPYASGADGRRVLRVSYRAGLAADWTAVPAALRQGVVRLVAHLYAHRDAMGHAGTGGEPPAAVAALWRTYRRMPFGRVREVRR